MAKLASAQHLIEKVVKQFRLNLEQERGFRIIANHASSPQSKQFENVLGWHGWYWKVTGLQINSRAS